jgi:RHS repeat-associated protein
MAGRQSHAAATRSTRRTATSNAKYTVSHAGGQSTLTANQQQNSATWQLLGTFSFDAGAATVTLTDEANGYVIADAVMLAPPGAAPNTATWSFNVASTGQYSVYARWSAHPNRATNAPFSVQHAGGATPVVVNQELNGGTWFLLGTFGFDAGPGSVTLTDQANDFVIADAVMVTAPDPQPNTATWTPNVAQAAQYEVYARWTASANRASNATYSVTHAGGTTPVTVSQKANGGTWNLLGTFNLSPGSAHKVALTDQANGFVIADAIRLVQISTPPPPPQLYFIHVDHLNTPRLVANAAGQTVWLWHQAEPFGNSVPDENPSGLGAFDLPLRFPGQRYDAETALHYNYYRDYDPSLGRYGESDPIGLKAGLNTYAYGLGAPLIYTDPEGLDVTLYCRGVEGTRGRYSHCYVHVTCPDEGIDEVLSLFGKPPYGIGGLPSTGYKSSASPMDGGALRDDPSAPGQWSTPITPQSSNCDCRCEKEVISRFYQAPATQRYGGTSSNSNTFAQHLITSPSCGTSWPAGAPANAVGTLPIGAGRIR